jgi:hypothetical protein
MSLSTLSLPLYAYPILYSQINYNQKKMKTQMKTGIVALLLLSAISCTKSINSPSPISEQALDNSEATAAFHIGQSYHGGIIFYIDGTGQHGLIAATSDQGTGIAWNNGRNIFIGANNTAVGAGEANTEAIISAQGNTGNYAALLCANYTSGGYNNWYLPSRDELNILYRKRNVVGGFSATNYWSSSEVTQGKAWDEEFGGGYKFKDSKSFTLNVRAISSF